MCKTLALELDMFELSVRIFGAECGCNRRTGDMPSPGGGPLGA